MRAKLAGVCLFTGALACATGAPAQESAPTKITDIRQESSDQATRLVLEATGPLASYQYYSPDPLTVIVDISGVDSSAVPARINVGSREVDSVRVTGLAKADGNRLTRVEVRLASLAPYQVFSREHTLNLVFDRPAATPAALPAADVAPARVAAASVPAAPEQAPPAERPATNPPGSKATRIVGVTRDSEPGLLAFTVKADGRLQYRDFLLAGPDRLVVDFSDVLARAGVKEIEVQQEPVRKVRLGQFSAAAPKVARLVVDLTKQAPYRIIEGSDGVRIVFDGSAQAAAAPAEHPPLAALAATPAPEPTAPAAGGPSAETLEPEPAAPVLAAMVAPAAPAPRPVALEPLALPEPAQETVSEPAAAAPEGNIGTACGHTGDLGTPISLDFKDGDLQDIFRLFSDLSGLNVVVNPGVAGKVTLKLNEVPWGRALELILKTNNLGCVLEDNVIRIAPLATLQKEEQDRRKLRDEKELAGDRIDFTKRISYAKADALTDVLRKTGALSSRGQINVDPRTNMIIIRDLPAFVDKARALIAELDTPTPQVEIEARIVVTNRNFTRDLGIQWGFGLEKTDRFGNTTSRVFPNSLVLNGGAVTTQSGILPDNLGPGGLSSGAGIGNSGRGYFINLPAASFNSGIGVSTGNILGSFNLDLALTALERQGRTRLLSSPKVTTQNNQTAEIKQGVQIPYQSTSLGTAQISFKDAALILRVTPQITDAGTIILNLEVENNSPDYGRTIVGAGGAPPINTQSAKTQLLVRDGQTAVVGGIFQSTEALSNDRTPFLSKVPVLGYLFKRQGTSSENAELLLFITPRIVKS